jgi:hypothetical protein
MGERLTRVKRDLGDSHRYIPDWPGVLPRWRVSATLGLCGAATRLVNHPHAFTEAEAVPAHVEVNQIVFALEGHDA